MESSQLILFVVTSLFLISTPGPDMVLVMSRSIAIGQRAGVATAAGVSVGLLGHTVLASLGLGAILQTSAMLFTILKLVGAVYLVYLGVKSFRSPPSAMHLSEAKSLPVRTLFLQGAISNISNPKIAIFYFAFLPQFVSAESANSTAMLLLLGVVFDLLTFLIKSPIAVCAGRLSGWLRNRPHVETWLNRISGSVLMGLGVRLALEKRLT